MIDRNKDPLGWAKEALKHIHEQQVRWGRQYSVATDRQYSPRDIADAAGIVMIELDTRSTIKPEELTKVKRQLAASKARETKAQKKVDQLNQELAEANDAFEEIGDQLDMARQEALDNWNSLQDAQNTIDGLAKDG